MERPSVGEWREATAAHLQEAFGEKPMKVRNMLEELTGRFGTNERDIPNS